jgi:hypothetical protein
MIIFDSSFHHFLEVGPSLGSSSRLKLKFRLAVNKLKARAQSNPNSKSSDELFFMNSIPFSVKFFQYVIRKINFGIYTGALMRLDQLCCKAQAWLGLDTKSSGSDWAQKFQA